MNRPATAPPVATKFGALRHRDYRRYFLVALLGLTAESVEHVVSYWVIFQAFQSPTLGGFAVISHWVPFLLFSVYAGSGRPLRLPQAHPGRPGAVDARIARLGRALPDLPLILLLFRMPYTGHLREGGAPRPASRLGLAGTRQLLSEARSEPKIIRMIVLVGATSFFVGTAFQAHMPEYAHHHGSEEADVWYSVLFGANAAGAVIGALLMETFAIFQGGARAAIVCAGLWGTVMAIFPLAHSYAAAVTLLVLSARPSGAPNAATPPSPPPGPLPGRASEARASSG